MAESLKAVCARLERQSQIESHIEAVVEEMETLIEKRKLSGALGTAEEDSLFLSTCFPKVIHELTMRTVAKEEVVQRVHKFFRVALKLIIESIPKNIVSIAEALRGIFNADNTFYFTTVAPIDPCRLHEDELWANTPQADRCCELVKDNINYFGSNQGFTVLFQHVAKDDTPIPVVAELMAAANQCLRGGYITRQKIPDYAEGCFASLRRLRALNATELARSTTEDFENMVKVAHNILRYKFKGPELFQPTETALLEVVNQCFHSAIHEKRDWSLRQLAISVNSFNKSGTSPGSYRWITVAYLKEWLVTAKILEGIFDTLRNVELIPLSAPVLRFLGQNQGLSKAHLDSLWACATSLQTNLALATFDLMGSVVADFPADRIHQLLSNIKEIPRPHWSPYLMAFITLMSKSELPALRLPFSDLLGEWSAVSLDLTLSALDPETNGEVVTLGNGQAQKRILATFLRLRCPTWDPKTQPFIFPDYVTQPLLDGFCVFLTGGRLADDLADLDLSLLAYLGTINKVITLEYRSLSALHTRLAEVGKTDCDRIARTLFTLIKLDPKSYEAPIGQLLKQHFVFSYPKSEVSARPPLREIIAALDAVDPTLVDQHLTASSKAPNPPVEPAKPEMTEPTINEALIALFKQRKGSGDFTIFASPGPDAKDAENTDPNAANAYRCHSFIFKAFWPYFYNLTQASMREASSARLTLPANITDGGLTIRAVEAIGELFYTQTLSDETRDALTAIDLLSVTANSGLYEFESIPALRPLVLLATTLPVDTSNCVEMFAHGVNMGIPDLVAECEKIILDNFSKVWSEEENQTILLALPTQIALKLIFNGMARLDLSRRNY